MVHEQADAMLDQLEAAMRDMADALQKLQALKPTTSQTLRMLSIVAKFGEVLGHDEKHPEKYDMETFLKAYMEENDEE